MTAIDFLPRSHSFAVVYFRSKTIKGTPLLQLVESYRNAEGSPRQRVIASLGDADIPETEKASIAAAVTRRLRGADSGEAEDWFEPNLSADAAAWVTRIVALGGRSRGGRQGVANTTVDGVLLDRIETTDVVEFGPELVALKAWEELGLTPMLASLGMNPSRIAPHNCWWQTALSSRSASGRSSTGRSTRRSRSC